MVDDVQPVEINSKVASLRDTNLKLRFNSRSEQDFHVKKSLLSIYNTKNQKEDRSPNRIILTVKDIKNPEKWFKAKMLSVPVKGDIIDIDDSYYEVLKVIRRVSLPNEEGTYACEVGITVIVVSTEANANDKFTKVDS